MERPFKVPVPYLWCTVGIILCIYLMLGLPVATYIRFVVWLAIGVADLPGIRVLALPAAAPLAVTSPTCPTSSPTPKLRRRPAPPPGRDHTTTSRRRRI